MEKPLLRVLTESMMKFLIIGHQEIIYDGKTSMTKILTLLC